MVDSEFVAAVGPGTGSGNKSNFLITILIYKI